MPGRPLRIVTYNVRYFGHALRGFASTRASKRGISRALASLSPLPDIVCLQEVETISVRSRLAHRPQRREETQLEAFMRHLEEAFAEQGRHLPYEALHFRAHSYRVGRLPIYTTGLAVLVNTATLAVDAHNGEAPHHITYHHLRAWREQKQSRICAHLRLVTPSGRRLHIFNTHMSLPTPWSKGFWAERDKMGFGVNQLHEARTLSEFVRRRAAGDGFVVCGDFNSPPGSPVYRFLTQESSLLGAQEALGAIDVTRPRAFPTAGFMRLRMHLDHLFSGGGLRWVDLEDTRPFGDRASLFHGLSDHVPLIARFDLR